MIPDTWRKKIPNTQELLGESPLDTKTHEKMQVLDVGPVRQLWDDKPLKLKVYVFSHGSE